MRNPYDDRYNQENYYWGFKPSSTCFRVLQLFPPEKPLRLLDVGCGEGRNAIFFARNGYNVTAFDLSHKGVEKTNALAKRVGVKIDVFEADILQFRLQETYDIIFSTGTFHYIPVELRNEIMANYMGHTSPSGLHALSVFVKKPFIPKAPDAESIANHWESGELFTYYHDWQIEYCTEEIIDCNSSGIPHKHATNRIIARKV
jgi:tellurite methyltransferase